MQSYFATLFVTLALAVLPQTLGALTQPGYDARIPALTSQSQTFVSTTTSLVRQGERHACVQSTGSDWKTHSTAVSLSEQSPVELQNLRSNTPYASLIMPDAQDRFLRIALGFRIANATVKFETSKIKLVEIDYEIEPRGDTLVIRASKSLADVLAALQSEDGLRITAQSQKSVPSAGEHVVSHLFKLDSDDAGLRDCYELVKKPAREHVGDVQIALGATARDDVDMAQAQAAACNRDLDPTNAELVAVSSLDGLTLPLSHALLNRDKDGNIKAIWAGDLLRIERMGSTYQRRISHSVQAQGPLDTQSVSACTRLAAPSCVIVLENSRGRISIMSCISDLIALAGRAPSGFQALELPLASLASISPSSGGGFGGGGGGSSSSSTPDTSTLPSSEEDIVEYILATHDPQRSGDGDDASTPEVPNNNLPTDPGVVPLPGGLGLLVFAVGLAVGASRRVA